MYPELTFPLVVALVLAVAFVLYLVVFRPVLRRLAVRQVTRRPAELVLVVVGSLLGTALIVASLTVGDSLNRSVRQAAYDTLGPVDEYVRSPTASLGDEAAFRLSALRQDPDVDGVLTMDGGYAAATFDGRGAPRAEPRVLAWDVDFASAARFGAPHPSGLAVPDPGPGHVVVNEHLARSLGVRPGDRVTFHAYGGRVTATVARVVPARGLAGIGLGMLVNPDAFFPSGTLRAMAASARQDVTSTTYVSNRGGVEQGAGRTDQVAGRMRALLGSLTAAHGGGVDTPKRDVLDQARKTGDSLGSLFLFIASFGIIAGLLLIVNIFVMLIQERRGQLGVLRAIGMRRRRVSHELVVEGALYTAGATLAGGLVGVGVGRVVVILAMRIFNGANTAGNRFSVVFAVTPVSVVNGMAAGFLMALAAVAVTSVRIARTNIIAAIRDLDAPPRRGARRRLVVVSAVATVLLAAASVPVLARGVGMNVYLLPALTVLAAVPLLRRFWSSRTVHTGVGLALTAWGLGAHLVRPRLFDSASTGAFIVMGAMLTFAAVLLVTQQQDLLLRPLRPLLRRPTGNGLATRLAIAYPSAKRFQTGATLAMYCIVVFVIVLLTQIQAIISAGVSHEVVKATAGWQLRADYNPDAAWADPARDLAGGPVAEAAVLTTTSATADDPLRRTTKDLPVRAIGIPPELGARPPALTRRLAGLPDDAAAWRLVLRDPSYVLIDANYGAVGGPQGKPPGAGSKLSVADPLTGRRTALTVAGVLADGIAFYYVGGEARFPVLMSRPAATRLFGVQARPSSVMLRLAPGADSAAVRAGLQARHLTRGLVVSDLQQTVRDNWTASRQFFTLMRGYLALGLLVGVVGLGVVMIRAVRERRRTVAVLRALGVQSRVVRRAFYAESTFVALEGVVIGTVLGVLTTWLLYLNSPTFGSLDAPYPIAWTQVLLTVGATLVASLLATVGPARRAARIRPAVALRIAD
ncbi:ABC transporter permease [Actinomadura gamaensis]|uniref:ABC transporter permease n=1 Tax=Actinomadura gamaensis TaxID=1763541 RepID=A0ABV9TZW4_9ACTN